MARVERSFQRFHTRRLNQLNRVWIRRQEPVMENVAASPDRLAADIAVLSEMLKGVIGDTRGVAQLIAALGTVREQRQEGRLIKVE